MASRKAAWVVAALTLAAVAAVLFVLRTEKPRTPGAENAASPSFVPSAHLPSPPSGDSDEVPDARPEPVATPQPGPPLSDVIAGMLEAGDIAGAEKSARAAGKVLFVDGGANAEVRDGKRVVFAVSDPQLAECAEQLNDDDAMVRADALQELFYLTMGTGTRSEQVMAAFLATDPAEEVRAAAAAGLEMSESPSTVDLLIRALGDSAEQVREQARTSLGLIRDPIVVAKLKEARARESDPAVRDIIDQLLIQSFDEPLTLDPALLDH
ncbi:MAG: hypothetical protein PWP23_337 [Candidatus Sumerlaeota bacterium]|nr:hypothetical protein [Candidatus Sumerlaeota bacterium]